MIHPRFFGAVEDVSDLKVILPKNLDLVQVNHRDQVA